MKFNEDSRVKIPAILHLTRLGYTYLSLKGLSWDESSNIVPSLFRKSVSALNPSAAPVDIENALGQLNLLLDNEDLGKQFYEKITETSGLKIIDFEDFNRNSFHVVTEFTCKKDDEEFRPDITLLINGLPIVFIEVKKPNNRDGILAERERINTRFKNKKFKKFIIATETGIFHEMQKRRPDAQLIQAPVVDEHCLCNDCPFMKMNSIEKIYHALKTFKPAVQISEDLRIKAFTSLDRMMKITSGQPVTWPEVFQG